MKKVSFSDFLEVAKNTHNYYYSYDKFNYINNSTKGIITCPIHGDFEQSPEKHKAGQGCKQCGTKKAAIARATSQEDFIQKCKSFYKNNEFDFSKTVFVNTSSKVIVTCKYHGDILMNPQNLLKGMSCKRCSVVKNKKDNFKLPENISLISFSYFEKECFLHCSYII